MFCSYNSCALHVRYRCGLLCVRQFWVFFRGFCVSFDGLQCIIFTVQISSRCLYGVLICVCVCMVRVGLCLRCLSHLHLSIRILALFAQIRRVFLLCSMSNIGTEGESPRNYANSDVIGPQYTA